MDHLLRTFVERTKSVFKLKIAIYNRDRKTAEHEGNHDRATELLTEQRKLVEKFKEWKDRVNERYNDPKDKTKSIQELRQKIRHAERQADRLCDEIDQRENVQQKKNQSGRLSDTFVGDRSNGRRSPLLGKSAERTNDKYPLKQDEYNMRMSIPLEEHLKLARSLSRADITSELKTDATERHEANLLFTMSWVDFTSYFIAENRKQHEADRLIEAAISKFVSYCWCDAEQFLRDGLMPPAGGDSTQSAQWIRGRLDALDKIVFRQYQLKKIDDDMKKYLRLLNNTVIDTVYQVLQITLFDSLRTGRIAEFCANPTLALFEELVTDEAIKMYGLFAIRRTGALATDKTHFERLRNEPSPSVNKWILSKVRLQHEIASLKRDQSD